MFKKRNAAGSMDRERQRKPVDTQRQAPAAPTYSYYANRRMASSQPTGGSVAARIRIEQEPLKRRWYQGRKAQFWAVSLVIVIVLIELTFLGGSGSVVVVDSAGNRDTAANTAAYEKSFDGLLGSSILNHNKLTIDTTGVAEAIRRAHPELESVTVVTPLFGVRPILYVHISEPAFTLRQGSESYVLSAAGFITGHTSKASLPIVVDETGEPVELSKQLLPASHVAFMQTVWYQLTKQGIAANTLVLPKGKAFEVDIRLKDASYYLKFNTAEDAVRQSGAAVAVIQQLGGSTPKEYIDLRVPGKVYYK